MRFSFCSNLALVQPLSCPKRQLFWLSNRVAHFWHRKTHVCTPFCVSVLSVATAQSCSHICGKFSMRFTRREKNTIVHYSHRQPPATHTLFAFLFLLFHFRAATFLSILQEYGCQQKYISRILGLHSRRHTPFCAFVSSFQTHTTTFAVNYKKISGSKHNCAVLTVNPKDVSNPFWVFSAFCCNLPQSRSNLLPEDWE